MMDFLDMLSQEVLNRHGDRLHSVCMVFPSRRAGLYFQKQLARNANKPIVLPEVITMVELMERISGLKTIDDIDQLFALYRIHSQLESPEPKPFDEVMGWAQIMLSDFNDVDLYMADGDAVFRYLDEAKAISLWNPSGEGLTEAQKKYLEFYGSIHKYYHSLRDYLISADSGYAGLVFRKAAEALSSNGTFGLDYFHYVFAGFNALSTSEETVLSALLERRKADVYWDADRYYLEDQLQEAGHYLRKKLKSDGRFGDKWISNSLATEPRSIEVSAANLSTGQAVRVAEILQQLPADETDRTVVVINDERIVFPLLHCIPEAVGEFNLTMGLSLKHTPAAEFCDSYFDLHQKYREGSESRSVMFRPCLRLMQHPWLQSILEGERHSAGIRKELSGWQKGNRVFVNIHELHEMLGASWEKVSILFEPWAEPVNGLMNLIGFLNILEQEQQSTARLHSLELAIIPALTDSLLRIAKGLPEGKVHRSRTLRTLVNRLVQRQSIRFSGEPIKGLQIMGMLETRLLDYDNVIVTGMNEGKIPQASGQASFIPHDVKHYFGLPMPSDKEAVFAYHYYRMIQRAHRVFIIYNSEMDAFGAGEKSRYLQQTMKELPLKNPLCTIIERPPTTPVLPDTFSVVPIAKDDSLIARLDSVCETGFSASHLMTYMRCPVKFYYQFIAGIEASTDEEDSMESSTLGSAIHDCLNEIYLECGESGSAEHLRSQIPAIRKYMESALSKRIGADSLQAGENYLLKEVAIQIVQRFLESEIERQEKGLGFKRIMALEKEFRTVLYLDEQPIMCKGKIDRIDLDVIDEIRIIDYKSGRVETAELKTALDAMIDSEGKKDKAFQLMFYAWLYMRNDLSHGSVKAGIFSFRNLGSGLIPLAVDGSYMISPQHIEAFEEKLKVLIHNILDPKMDLVPTQKLSHCAYCDYKDLCGRN